MKKSRFLRIVGASALAAALTAGAILPVLASPAGQEANGKAGIFGTVTARADNSLSLQTKGGATVDLSVDGQTEVRIPGEAEASIQDVNLGSRVAVLAEGEAGAQSALKVMVIPGEPQREHRVLTVVEVSGNTVVAEDAEGNKVVVEMDHEVDQNIKGQLITFIGARSEQSDRFKANAEVKIGQIVERLEAHSLRLEAEAKAEVGAEAKAEKEERLVQLRARIEAIMQRHVDLFTEIIAEAPAQAKASLEAALELTLSGYQKALLSLGGEAHAGAMLQSRTALGAVSAVNTSTSEFNVKLKSGAEASFKVDADTQIRIDGEAGAFADIMAGDQVIVRYDAETNVATEIRVKTTGEVKGSIQSFDSASGQLVIALAGDGTVVVNVTSETDIEVNGESGASADLALNALVEVVFDLHTMAALEVQSEASAKVEGTIKGIDLAARTVTVTSEDGDELVLSVNDNTRVNIHGLLFGLLGLAAGMEVEAQYDMASKVAIELKARAESVAGSQSSGSADVRADAHVEAKAEGKVSSADSASGKLVVTLQNGQSLEIHVDSTTNIVVNGEVATLADVKAGADVQVKYEAQTMVAHSVEAESETQAEVSASASIAGELKSVDLLSGTVTIVAEGGAQIVLDVTGETQVIAQSWTTSGLTALVAKVGAEVKVEYNAETNVASKIHF